MDTELKLAIEFLEKKDKSNCKRIGGLYKTIS